MRELLIEVLKLFAVIGQWTGQELAYAPKSAARSFRHEMAKDLPPKERAERERDRALAELKADRARRDFRGEPRAKVRFK